MRQWRQLGIILLCLTATVVTGCRRQELRTIVIRVPDLRDDRTAALVRNALWAEMTRYEANIAINLKEATLNLSASGVLKVPEVQARLRSALQEVGFAGTVVGVRTAPVDHWPDRHVMVIRIPEVTNNLTANIAAAAVTHALTGQGSAQSIHVHPERQEVAVTYNSMVQARRNFEHAIACAGLRTADIPPNLGYPDPLPHGWILP